MDSIWLVAGVSIAAAFVLLLAALQMRGSLRRTQTEADRLQAEIEAAEALARSRAVAESEIASALEEARSRVEELEAERGATSRLIESLQGEVDDLRTQLATADRDLGAARENADHAATEVARLEAEVARLEQESIGTLQAAEQVAHEHAERLERAVGEHDAEKALLLERIDALTDDLAGSRAEVEQLRAQVEELLLAEEESTTEGDDRQVRERLVASEALRRDLEDRLDALHAVRAAEQRRVADLTAAGDRLHAALADREARLEELEADLKRVEESRDEALAEAAGLEVRIAQLEAALEQAQQRVSALEEESVGVEKGSTRIAELEEEVRALRATSAEVERLRRSLDAERARAERISRRAVDGVPADATYAMWERVLREKVDSAVERETVRLGERIEHLRTVVAEKEARIRALVGGEPLTPLSVTDIKGIGPKIEEILREQGVTTVADIAALSDQDIDQLGEHMPVYPQRIVDDDWVGQAKTLLASRQAPPARGD